MTTGRPPFEGEPLAVLGQIAHVEPPPPSTLRAEVDPVLEGIIQKALAKDIGRRYRCAIDFAQDLQHWCTETAMTSGKTSPGATDSFHPEDRTAASTTRLPPGELKARVGPQRWGLFLLALGACLVLGASAATGCFLLLWHLPARGYVPLSLPTRNDPRPPDGEVLDYLDGKTIPPNVPGVDKARQPLVLQKNGITELHFQSASKGNDDPWNCEYSFLYDSGGPLFIIDVSIPIRQLGSRRVFLDMNVRQLTKVDKVGGERAPK
jgi:hypothetical protein